MTGYLEHIWPQRFQAKNKRSVKTRYDQWENSRTKRRKILKQWCQRHERIKMVIFTHAQWIIGEYAWKDRFLLDVMHNYYLVMRRGTKLLLKSNLALRRLWVPGNLWWCEWTQLENKQRATGYTPTMTQLSQVQNLWLNPYKPLGL